MKEFVNESRELEGLEAEQVELRHRAFQRVSMEFAEATKLDEESGDYLQGVAALLPEPTKAFRMDSKKEYIGDDDAIVRHSVYFYVPADAKPDEWLTRFWVRHVGTNGVEGMFAIDQQGVRPYQSEVDIEAELSETVSVVSVDFSPAGVVQNAIEQKKAEVRGLKRIVEQIRDDFKHVEFDS